VRNKTNILQITLSLEIGGLEVLLLEFLKTLNRDKYNVSVCVLQEKGALIEEIRNLDIPVYIIPKKEGVDYGLPLKLRKLIKENDIQIVHTHNSTPWLYAGLAIKGMKNIRLIHTKHSNLALSQKRMLKAERMLSKKTDYIIADSRDVYDFMINNQRIPEDKIKIIFNGINTDKFNNPPILRDKKTIAIIGRIAAVKDHKTLISAFKIASEKLSNARLLIVGDGELLPDLRKQVADLKLQDKVIFAGFRRDIPELLRSIDALVLCSESEGMSIALLEAMATGSSCNCHKCGRQP
jgi:Glycosyltransferase